MENSYNRFRRKKKFFFIIPILLVFGVTWIVMWLWNTTLVPAISGIAIISYWQAMGILALSKILFGGFKGGFGGRHRFGNRSFGNGGAKFSDEEKQQFKSMWKQRFENRCQKNENN